ncbi:MAG TPA: ABC transporter permease, partial [Vicinamibacterales bacterium]|nr:ABC transporter permease [Vicinamibacterales bacterium]
GANSAIFTVVNGVLLQPLPYGEPDRLMMVWSTNAREQKLQNVVSPANFIDLRDGVKEVAELEAFHSFIANNQMRTDEGPERVLTSSVGLRLFAVLEREPLIGRTFTADDTNVAVLSHGFWQRRFGGDQSILGRQLTIGDTARTVIGVMPESFVFPYQTMLGADGFTRSGSVDVWLPWVAERDPFANRGGIIVRSVHYLAVVGRLTNGASADALRDRTATIANRLAQAYPASNAGWGTSVVSLHEQAVGSVRPALLVLLAGVGLVLLMACVNVANLALARSLSRQRELAVRAALGAGRWRLIRQSLTESLMLAVAGSAVALLFVRWGVRGLLALAPATLPRLSEVEPDLTVFGVTLAAGVIVGIAVGLAPALAASRPDVREALQEGGRGTAGSAAARRARSGLVIGEVALAVVLTAGTALLLRSFSTLLAVDPGFRPDGLLTMQVELPARIDGNEARLAYYDELFERLRAIPGVIAAGGTTRLPLGSTSVTTSVNVEGRPRPEAELPEVQFRRAVDDYFTAMGISLRRGRGFTVADGPNAPRVCIINEAMAARLFPGEDPVGHRISTGPSPSPNTWMTIVGVIGNVRHASLDEVPAPELYISHRQGPPVAPFIALRTSLDPAALADTVRANVRQFDRSLALYDLRTMTEVRTESVSQRRFILVLMAAFGLLALVLAAVGVYGVTTLLVGERTREMGLRLALGAAPASVLRLVLGQVALMTGAGLAVGLILAWLLSPLLVSQLYGIQPADPMSLAIVAIVLMAVSLSAAAVPARRAMRADPLTALRVE